ncbi:hypothetical protein JI721_16085 [Alicyclobacillus cycloheptanicus]|uniref:Uncharacterized protein n=1 Tax=Alicyclobacillus cycloheptanicus TaxID=1457 RepID=A0ABT9XF57_9BACL|nr:hypothetical protein [Alicyclobacillus cycloheptanicus]MDQ0188463.1 hypothetical protein [Alicyclobacillus cycloheptanicus]WDM01155.1 hypothetical protein JI721_16085 [Alicyclobacillus cycloheptanicus]
METRLVGVYLLSVEEPDDYIFVPAGVVVLMERQQFQVYCVKSSHNLYRQALHKFSFDELEQGVRYRDYGFRLEDLSTMMVQHGWVDTASIPDILANLYERNPRHLFFLRDIVHALR